MLGTVKSVVLDRGFGFIVSPDLDEDIFFHISGTDQETLDWDDTLQNRRVLFETTTRNGREQAVNVRAAD